MEKGRICIIDHAPYSGSNANALYRYLKNKITDKNDLVLIDLGSINKNIIRFLRYLHELSRSQIIITTSGCFRIHKKQILVQLWHGVAIKSIGLMDKNLSQRKNKEVQHHFSNYELIISTSQFYNVIANSCFGANISKYYITGLPRNDLLLKNDSVNRLEKIINCDLKDKKIIFYVPTFRMGFADRIEGIMKNHNVFGFNEFDYSKFYKYLENTNIIFFMKLHPFEEKLFKKNIKKYNSDRFFLIELKTLTEENIDLYEILGSANLLITDYSSVYFDFLILQRQIIFINNDIDIYKKKRGILLEPYDFWTPGPKVKNQVELQKEITKCFNSDKYYVKEREVINSIINKYKDNRSCERIHNVIKKLI
jgi:CDP-glycerol glycerophosphotransferase (TagB/SpsB family)